MSRDIPNADDLPGVAQFRSNDAIDRLMASTAATGGAFRTPLFDEAREGVIAATLASHGEPIPGPILRAKRPSVIVLCDDHPGATGPKAWRQAPKLMRWARKIALHATGGMPEHYHLFAMTAQLCGRVLVVEMESRHLPAWRALALKTTKPANVLLLLSPDGQHPVQGAPSGVVAH